MIAARFRLVGWVAGCAGAALMCYMASQSVAAERSALAKVDGEIASTKVDIDRLETEITARSRAGQVERWNGVLALQAARPAQYATSGVQLASMAGGRKLPLDPAIVASHGAVTTVAYQPAAPAVAPTPMPAVATIQPAMSAPRPVATPVAAPKIIAPKIIAVAHVVADRPAAHVQPLLHQAAYVRPAVSRLGDSDGAFLRASYEKPVPAKAIDAGMAKADKAKADTPKSEKVARDKAKPEAKSAARAEPKAAAKAEAIKPAAAAKPALRIADAEPARPKLKLAKLDKLDGALLPSDLGKLIAAERKPKAAKRAL